MEIKQHKDRYDKLTPTVQNRLDDLLQEDEKYIRYTITAGEGPGAYRETDIVKENGEWKLDEIPNAYLTYQSCE